ncbi:sodium channel protein Nach [Atheta coriaria]|uniref:sodium channel protein Nach n=1 Tax=Dalotia coriaria TaxID=877792 RepID=UPI0031F3BF77
MKVKSGAIRSRRSSNASLNKWRSAKKRNNKNHVPMHKLLKASWKYQGKIFFAESTLHGVRYIAETDRPIIERLIWFICVMVGAISTMVIIVSLWEKFQTNPTITGLDTDFHNWDIPYPSVTLCPNQPWNIERLNASVEKIRAEHNLDEAATKDMNDFLQRLTQLSLLSMNPDDYQSEYDAILKDQDLHKLTYELMVTCEEFLVECKWKALPYNCCDSFFPSYTENGFCFAFNSLHYERKSPTGEEYPPIDPSSIMYIKETDSKLSLLFTVDPIGRTEHYNILIFLHKANELPGINLKPQHVWDFKMGSMSFSMRETYTTDDATQLSIKQRHCIYDHEMKLEIDSIYTYAACAHQCRMNNARRLCSCIPHFYSLAEGYKHCNVSQLKCIATNKKEISNIEKCGCELGCSNTIYEVDKLVESAASDEAANEGEESDGMPAEQLFSDEEETNTTDSSSITNSTEDSDQSLLGEDSDQASFGEDSEPPTKKSNPKFFECEFTSWPMIKYKREVLFGWVDLLVSFGGIAGLFLGFSLLSGVEIIYYFTIRACCMIYKQRDELETMATNPGQNEKKDYDLGLVPYFIKEPKPGQGEEMLRRRIKDNSNFKVQPLQSPAQKRPMQPMMVKPLNPQNKVVPPFGFDYYN